MLVTLMPTTIRPNSFFMQLIIHFMRLHHKKYSYGFISHVLWTKHCIFHSSWGAFFTYFPPNKRCHLWWCFGKIQPYQDLSESFKATRLKEDRDVAKAAIPRKMQNSYTAHRQSYIKGKSALFLSVWQKETRMYGPWIYFLIPYSTNYLKYPHALLLVEMSDSVAASENSLAVGSSEYQSSCGAGIPRLGTHSRVMKTDVPTRTLTKCSQQHYSQEPQSGNNPTVYQLMSG